jgi:hypothetical protein
MKFILKPVIAAALFASANAFAALASPSVTPGNGELFLTLFDATAQVSYTLDLGVGLKDFRSAADLVRPTGTAGDSVVAQDAVSLLAYNRTFAINESGSEFQSFLAASSNSANWRWFVTAGDNFGSNTTANAKSLVTTVTTGVTPTAILNGAFNSALVGIGNTITNTIVAKGDADNKNTNTAINGSVFGSAGNGAYALGKTSYVGNNGAGFFGFNSDNGIGDTAAFYYLGRSGSDLLAPVVLDQFNNSVNPGLFQVVQATPGDFSLQYSIAAVPEPGTYALMFAGLAAIGFLVSRRRA